MFHRLIATAVVCLIGVTEALSQQSFEPLPFVTDQTQYFTDMAWGDYDQDGDLDLLTTGQITGGNTAYDMSLFRNDGIGNFERVPVVFPNAQPVYVDWADLDNDSDLDILLVGTFDGLEHGTHILRNDGFDQFSVAEHNLPEGRMFRLADFNADGLIDVAWYEYSFPMRIYRNDGGFQFTPVMDFEFDGEELTWNDFDNDGLMDFSRGKYLYRNTGNDQFTTIDMGFTNNGVSRYVWGDFDSDGDDDFLRFEAIWTYFPDGSGTADEHINMYENTGNAVFVDRGRMNEVTSFNETATFDFDGDGDLDILLTQGEFAPVQSATQILKNNGGWSFQKQYLHGDVRSKYSFAVADYDNDRDPDVIISGEHLYKVTLLKNNLIPKPQLPAVPTNVTTSVVGDVLTLSWNAATDAESSSLRYNIYVKRDSTYFVTPHTGFDLSTPGLPGHANAGHLRTKALDISAWPDGYYTWGVQSVDNEWNVSSFTGESQFTRYSSNGPSAPTNLRTTAVTSRSVQLQWDDNVMDEISYTLERSTANGNKNYQPIATLPPNTNSYEDDALSSNIRYYYRVRLNRSGTEALSNVVGIRTPPGINVAPTSLTVTTVSSSQLKLDWLYSGGDHAGFVIQRSENKRDFISIDSVDAPGVTFTDHGLESRKMYFYRVLAYGAEGISDFSNVAYTLPPAHGFHQVTLPTLAYEFFSGYNMAWGDYDNDGLEDLFIGDKCQLLRNLGNGTFEPVTHNIALGENLTTANGSWGDFDSDGKLDIIVSDEVNKKVFRNKGNGVFEALTCAVNFDASPGSGMTWLDIDQDGDLDIVMGRYYYRYDGEDIFVKVDLPGQPENYYFTYTTAGADFNADGNIDLFISNYGSDQLLLGDDAGNFIDILDSPAVSDTDYDCCPIQSPFATWVDFNNDGHLDFSAVHSIGDRIYTGNGSTLTNIDISLNPYNNHASSYWEDYDNDGDLDYIKLGGYDHVTKILENSGNGTLTENISTGLSVPVIDFHTLSWFDYDNDGFRDAITFGPPRQVFRNGGNSNRWLKIRLAGEASNSLGVGAAIFVKTGTTWQRRDVNTRHSHLVQQGFESLFGLRTATRADSIKVLWPSGAVQTLVNIPSNQTITIREQDAQIKPFYKPSNLRGRVTPPSTLALIWKDNSSDEDGFILQHSADGLAFEDLATVEANVHEYVITDLAPGSTHYYRVAGIKGGVRSATTNIYKEKLRYFDRIEIPRLTTYAFPGSGVAWSDFNGDGFQDLFVNGGSFEGDALYRNTGKGSFVKELSLPGVIFNNSRSGTWGDLNNDGLQDLFLAVGGSYSTVDEAMMDKMYRNTGSNTFAPLNNTVTQNVFGSHSAAWGDLNGDRYLDLLVATDRQMLKYINLGGSSFSAATPLSEYSPTRFMVLSDFDNDNDLDVFQATSYSPYFQILKNDLGELRPFLPLGYDYPRSFAVEDFDGDGDFDILAAGDQGASMYTYNAATRSYTMRPVEGTSGPYLTCVTGDYDNNGYLDIILTKAEQDNEFYLNNGTSFVRQTGEEFSVLRRVVSIGQADYDRNGTLDLLLTSDNSDTKRQLFSGLPTGNHWSRVKLVGTQSNRDGIGAKIKIFHAGKIQRREMRSSSGSYSSHEQIAHFGLGTSSQIDYLKIEWPSGIHQWIANPEIDSLLVIEEAETPAPEIELTAPAQLQATPLPELKVALAWQDNSSVETGFKVMRSINGGSFVDYVTLPNNTTEFVDDFSESDEPELTVQYKVVAVFDDIASEASNTVTVVIVITGIESYSDAALKLYPNPSDRGVTVESDKPMAHIALYTATGSGIREWHPNGSLTYPLDVSQLGDGLYLMKIKTSEGNQFRKLDIRRR